MALNEALRQQLRAAAGAAVLVDRGALGRLRATGADVPDLLNRLSTNLVDPLAQGRFARTILTTNKGRILDALTLLSAPDHVLILTSAGALEKVAAWLEKYTIAEDAAFADVSAQTAHIALTGPKSPAVVAQALGPAAGGLAPGACADVSWQGTNLLVARTDPLGARGYDLIAPAQHGDALRQHLLIAGKSLGVTSATHEAWEALRVQAGIPAFGHELTEAYNPLEAGLDGLVSWTKGCYIGQEVVARLKTYHKVQRFLVRFSFDTSEEVTTGSKLVVDGAEAGVLTSAAPSPDGKGALALGYLRTAFLKDGAGRRVGGGGRVTGAPVLPDEALTPLQLMALAAEAEEEE